MAFSLRRNDFHLIEAGTDHGFDRVADIDHLTQFAYLPLYLQHAIDTHATLEDDLFIEHIFLEVFVAHVEVDCLAAFVVDAFPAVTGVFQHRRDDFYRRLVIFDRRQLIGTEDIIVKLFAFNLQRPRAAAVVFVQFAQGELRHLRIAAHSFVKIRFALADARRCA